MEMKVFEGKTIEDAVEKASKELNIEKSELRYEVLEEGGKGFFKVFSKKPRIKVILKSETTYKEKLDAMLEEEFGELNVSASKISEKIPTTDNTVEAKSEKSSDEEVIEFVKEYLSNMFNLLGVKIRFDYRLYKNKVSILLFTQGDYIETNNFEEFIYSIRYLLSKIVSKKFNSNLKFEVDINEYVKKKIQKLKQIAKEVSEKAKSEQKSIKLRPMYPNERKVIHIALKNDKDIKTESIGNGDKKQVMISPIKH
jgi:spoIIIJ-associated protein